MQCWAGGAGCTSSPEGARHARGGGGGRHVVGPLQIHFRSGEPAVVLPPVSQRKFAVASGRVSRTAAQAASCTLSSFGVRQHKEYSKRL